MGEKRGIATDVQNLDQQELNRVPGESSSEALEITSYNTVFSIE